MARISIATPAPKRDFSGAMTDISFLLIIFFIISAVFMADQGILLVLPDRESEPRTVKPDEVIRMSITAPAVYSIDGTEILPAGLRSVLSEKVLALADPIMVLTVSDGVSYQEVLDVLEEAHFAGCSGFSVQTDRKKPFGVNIETE